MARLLALKTDVVFHHLRCTPFMSSDDELLRADLIWRLDLSELGLGKHEIEYDPSKPGEKEEADRRIAEISAHMAAASRPAPARKRSAPVLAEIIEEFLSAREVKRRKNKPATVRKDRDALTVFQFMVGSTTLISDVNQSHAKQFADHLETRNIAPNTMNNYMSTISKFSDWLMERRPDLHPKPLSFKTLRFHTEKRADEEREQFTVAEVRRILCHPMMLAFKEAQPYKYWLPQLSAYQAMRVEEIAQLDPTADIYLDGAGNWVIDINNKDRKQLKNQSAKRVIPAHPQLLALGFLDYVERMKSRGAKRLFPECKRRDGRLAKNPAKMVNHFFRVRVGIPKTLHSFRHTVGTLLKHSLADERVCAEFMGHRRSGGETFKRYGKQYPSEVLLAEVIPHIRYGIFEGDCRAPARCTFGDTEQR
jgi:site-specific recombinase XerD